MVKKPLTIHCQLMSDLDVVIEYINSKIFRGGTQLELTGSILMRLTEEVLWLPGFKLYQNHENFAKLCEIFEAAGWSCRYAMMGKWNLRQGQQTYGFELSKNVKFIHRKGDDYNGELMQASNKITVFKSPGVFETVDP